VTLAAVPLAGIAAGATARRSVPALLGLLGGVVVPVTIVSLQYLLGKIAQCPQNDCGISGPGLTAVIVGVIIGGAALIAMAGFAAGRIVRRRFPSWPGL